MKKNTLPRKCFALCLASIMLLMNGCGSSDTGSNSKNSSDSESGRNTNTAAEYSDESGKITDEAVELTIWKIWQNDYVDLNNLPAVKALEEMTGVKINYITVSWAEASEKFALMLTSGDYPDIIDSAAGSYPGGGETAISDGVYLELTDYIEKYMPNYKAYREGNEEVRKATMTDSGQIFAVYMLRATTDGTLAGEPAWAGLSIRKDWLDQLDKAIPETIDEWHEVLTAFKNEFNAEAPLMINPEGEMVTNSFLSAYGVKSGTGMYLDGNTVKYGPLEEGYRQYVELMRQWYAEGLIDQNFLSNDAGLIPANFAASDRTGAGGNLSGWVNDYYYKMGMTDNEDFWLSAVQAPVLNKGETAQSRMADSIVGSASAITTACKYPEIAAQWMDFMYSEEGLLYNNYGILGETYDIDADGSYYYTDTILNSPENLSSSDYLYQYVRGDGVGLCAWDRFELLSDESDDEVVENPKEIWNSDGTALDIPGAVTMSETEGSEFSLLFSDIKSYVQEKTVSYIIGTDSMDTYDKFVEDIKGMNIAKCIEIQQAAYERYLER